MFDSRVPSNLRDIQEWFGALLQKPIGLNSKLEEIDDLANEHIAPSPTLTPQRRLEIYYQQYWWRLLTALQEVYPTLTRLFGYASFNEQIAVPYLLEYPPNHWSLGEIGRCLPEFLEKTYFESDRTITLSASKLDWTFWEIVFISSKKPLSFREDQIQELLDKPLKLQPHLRLFRFPFDLLKWRAQFLQKPALHWLEHDFPYLPQEKKSYNFLLCRNLDGNIIWEEILSGEYFLLQEIKKGNSLNSACLELEEIGGDPYNHAKETLSIWINKWIKLELLI